MNTGWKAVYYSEQGGSIPVKGFIDSLSLREQAKALAFIGLLEDGIHELRIKLKGAQIRILYFFCYQNIIVLTNAFGKHSDKVPAQQICLAKENRKDFLNRFSENDIKEKVL